MLEYVKKIQKHFLNISGKNLWSHRLYILDSDISCGCVLPKMLRAGRLLEQNVLPAVHSILRSSSASASELGQREFCTAD